MERLRSPAPIEAVQTVFAERGMTAPTEVIDFYTWHDGTDIDHDPVPSGQLWFTPEYVFLPLMHAAAEYDERVASEGYWDPSWWPLLADGVGTYRVAVCFNEPNVSAPVVEYHREINQEAVIHASLSRLVVTVLAAFDEGALTVDRDQMLDLDVDRYFDEIGPRLNPGVPYWSED